MVLILQTGKLRLRIRQGVEPRNQEGQVGGARLPAQSSLTRPGTHQHLPAGHEVGALADPLKDALQLGADETVVLGDRGTRGGSEVRRRGGSPPWEYLSRVLAGEWGAGGRHEVKGRE